jgi:hypothetical protein
MVVEDQALTWYGAFRQLVTEVIDETWYHSTSCDPRQDPLTRLSRVGVSVYLHILHVMRSFVMLRCGEG